MKLYYAPGVCSLAPHIVLREAALPFTLVKVDLKTKAMEGGGTFLDVNPMGYVPVLELDDGTRLTEGPAITQYIADTAGRTDLCPAAGTIERVKLQSLLNFISTELHKGFSSQFNPKLDAGAKAILMEKLVERIACVDKQLAGREFLGGKSFTIADAYAFVVLNWSKPLKLDLSAYTHQEAWRARIRQRPAVEAAMKAEGLIK
jgi:glutathione S-transferase